MNDVPIKTVSFRQMIDGTKEDYDYLQSLEPEFTAKTPLRVLDELAAQEEDTMQGYRVTRLGHALQSATRAWRDGADDDWVVGALLHDIGDGLVPYNHDKLAGLIVQPFVREEVWWVVNNHYAFQKKFFGQHTGDDPNARDAFKDNPYFQSAADFTERWDQTSFDDTYDTFDLSYFVPFVERVFAREPFDPAVIRKGEVVGLPPSKS